MLKIVLIHPEIPWNTGNIARTCVAAGAELHLVAPLGFILSERRLKRAGMDYWQRLNPRVHDSLEAFLKFLPAEDSVLAFSADGSRPHWGAPYRPDSWLIFGSESRGLPEPLRERWRENLYRIPMVSGARSLNLSTTVAVALYEALRVGHRREISR